MKILVFTLLSFILLGCSANLNNGPKSTHSQSNNESGPLLDVNRYNPLMQADIDTVCSVVDCALLYGDLDDFDNGLKEICNMQQRIQAHYASGETSVFNVVHLFANSAIEYCNNVYFKDPESTAEKVESDLTQTSLTWFSIFNTFTELAPLNTEVVVNEFVSNLFFYRAMRSFTNSCIDLQRWHGTSSEPEAAALQYNFSIFRFVEYLTQAEYITSQQMEPVYRDPATINHDVVADFKEKCRQIMLSLRAESLYSSDAEYRAQTDDTERRMQAMFEGLDAWMRAYETYWDAFELDTRFTLRDANTEFVFRGYINLLSSYIPVK